MRNISSLCVPHVETMSIGSAVFRIYRFLHRVLTNISSKEVSCRRSGLSTCLGHFYHEGYWSTDPAWNERLIWDDSCGANLHGLKYLHDAFKIFQHRDASGMQVHITVTISESDHLFAGWVATASLVVVSLFVVTCMSGTRKTHSSSLRVTPPCARSLWI